MSKIIITGGSGFIGTNLISFLLAKRPQLIAINVDDLSLTGRDYNAESDGRYQLEQISITDKDRMRELIIKEKPDAIINLAAQTHVDRSLKNVLPFFWTNVLGTLSILEAIREAKQSTWLSTIPLVHISTDEVYGELPVDQYATEQDKLNPGNPYSATKAGADLMINAYVKTHKMRVRIVRLANCYGPYQLPEKFIPVAITNLLTGKPIPVYGEGRQRRQWLYVEEACQAILTVLDHGEDGKIYNANGGTETDNITMAKKIAAFMDRPETEITFVEDRKGHDFRYGMNDEPLRDLGWRPFEDLDLQLQKTIQWYREHEEWWRRQKQWLNS